MIVLVNLALALGLGLGYLRWGRAQARLRAELETLALRPAAVAGEWTTRGVVRAILPDLGVVVVTHAAIGDVMPPMTMGFRASGPATYTGVQTGDEVQFTVRGVPPNLVIVRIEKLQ